MPVAEKDPWIDEHTQVDLQHHAEDKSFSETLTDIANEAVLDGLPDERGINFVPAGEPVVPVADVPEPKVITLEDGSTITVEQTKRGLKATLDSVTSSKAEVFYGKNESELLQTVLVGKLNATKKINELSRRSKVSGPVTPVAQAPAELPQVELTADQKFEIKTALDAGDMAKAMSLTLRYQFGRDLKDVVAGSDSGQLARTELDIESISNSFRAANPGYYNAKENFYAILGWLAGRIKDCPQMANDGANADAVFDFISAHGYYTVANLQRAYDELVDVLTPWPAATAADEEIEPEPEPTPAPRRAAPAQQAPISERIVREVRRPRAGLGIRPSTTTSGKTPDAVNVSAPSVDEIDNLSDAEFDKLYSATIRHARQTSARR